MSRITLGLIRKRSEHNEGEISTLEEIALHQENIKKIELIDRTCKNLKILLLQNNLISRIENLSRLKRLEYLNLALNNIESIENLEGLESLRKLDLTVNFIGDLRGVERLSCNENLEQLFLMGNPCADQEGYREYAIATLTQLKELDGTPIERSERIKALQMYARVEGEVIRNYARYRKTREAETFGWRGNAASETCREDASEDEPEENDEFWMRTSRHTPEERVAIAERVLRRQEEKHRGNDAGNESRSSCTSKMFNPEGKPYNVNRAKVAFRLNDEEYTDRLVLEVALYKYLDSVYVDVDVQPEYVRVTIKGKVLQLTLPCEVSVDNSTAKRNTTNGKLVVTMPRLNRIPVIGNRSSSCTATTGIPKPRQRPPSTIREHLEIGPATDDVLDFSKIVVARGTADRASAAGTAASKKTENGESHDDDSNVPPLE